MQNLTGVDISNLYTVGNNKNKKATTSHSRGDLVFLLSPFLFLYELFLWLIAKLISIIDISLKFVLGIEKYLIDLRQIVFRNLFWGRSGTRFAFLRSIALLLGFLGGVLGIISLIYSYTNTLNKYISIKQSTVYASGQKQEIDAVIATVSLETLVQTKGYIYETKYYTVKPGDTISSIATKFNVSADTIRWANNLKTDFIKVGQKLKIPPGSGVLHKVKKGETIASIAKKYKASPQAILEANFLDNDKDLKAGMEIFVPNGTLPAPPKPKYAAKPSTSTNTTNYKYKPPTIPSGKNFLIWPVAGGGTLTQRYWYRHKAIDIANNAYTRRVYGGHPYILAAASGKVSFAGYVCNAYRCGYAYMIEIQHPNGYSTLYAHLQPGSIMVRKGQWVTQGQKIARMGESGWAYGTHLHFEVAIGKYPFRRNLLNPLYYIK